MADVQRVRGNDDPTLSQRAALAVEATGVFDRLRRALKQIALYRHNVDRYPEYLEGFTAALQQLLQYHPLLAIKVDATAYKVGTQVVFEDEGRETNIIYPLWSAGVRLLTFKQGLTADEVQRFFLTCMGSDDPRRGREDIITQIWKAELTHIEYVVVEGFKALPDEDVDEVEIEIEKIVAHLYRQMQSSSEDYLRFARISSEDLDLQLSDVDQLRGAVIQGVTATPADRSRLQQQVSREENRHLQKMVVVLFQLLELDTSEENFDDVAESFIQLLDALILQENFSAIEQIRSRFEASARKPHISPPQRTLILRCQDRFVSRMAESQRVQAIGQILNAGVVKDVDGIRSYLRSLGEEALIPLVDMLESLQLPLNRRLVADVLVELGGARVDALVQRLTHPSSNLVKDIIYILDRINPPNKFALFSSVLEHPNAILRLETLTVIGRSGTDECFDYLAKTIRSHADVQMRAQAIRMLPNYAPEKASHILLDAVKSEAFEKLGDAEQKAIFHALAQIRTPEVDALIQEIFEQKGGLFTKKRTDDLKILAIGGIESAPSIPGLQLLVQIAQDKKHSKDVCETARAAIVTVKARLTG